MRRVRGCQASPFPWAIGSLDSSEIEGPMNAMLIQKKKKIKRQLYTTNKYITNDQLQEFENIKCCNK